MIKDKRRKRNTRYLVGGHGVIESIDESGVIPKIGSFSHPLFFAGRPSGERAREA